jgi:hypothetical protein
MAFLGKNDDVDGANGGASSSNDAHCPMKHLTKILGPQRKGKRLRGPTITQHEGDNNE